MPAVILQTLGIVCLVIAAGIVAPVLGLVVFGVAMLTLGILEELR